MPPLRRPLRQGRLPGRLPRARVPVRLRVRGVRPHLHRLHAEGLRGRDRPRPAAGGRATARRLRRRRARRASRCRCARPRSSRLLRAAAATSSAASTRSSSSSPSASPTFRVFAQVTRRVAASRPQRACRSRSASRSPRRPGRARPAPGISSIGRQALERRVAEEHAELLAHHRPRRCSSCRSRFEPSGAFESLTCSARSRSRPMRAVDLVEQAVERVPVGHVVRRTRTGGTSRGRCRAADGGRARSKSASSSSTDRPIVPPAPAEFSISSHVVSEQSSSDLLERRNDALEPRLEARALMRADVEDDAVGPDRARGRRPSSASSSTLFS